MSTDPISYAEFAMEIPGLAAAVRTQFQSERHHVLATLRADGSPRVSGTEVQFFEGHLTIGSMPGATKARDLLRDPRYALHAHTGDGGMANGDAKVSGVAVEVADPEVLARFVDGREIPPGPFHLFQLLVSQVVRTTVHPEGDRLILQIWRAGAGMEIAER
jgi:hypothetical protein